MTYPPKRGRALLSVRGVCGSFGRGDRCLRICLKGGLSNWERLAEKKPDLAIS